MSPAAPFPRAQKRVAVVVPAPPRDRTELTPDEQVSLRHLQHHLGRYDRYLVVPEGSSLTLPGFRNLAFPRRYFGGIEAHGQLLLSPGFYETFLDYEYILIHHMDALVLSDQLLEWCDREFDYVGPPLLVDDRRPEKGFMGVGNGGFSLRRVRGLLRAIGSRRYQVDPEEHWRKHYAHLPLARRLSQAPAEAPETAARLQRVPLGGVPVRPFRGPLLGRAGSPLRPGAALRSRLRGAALRVRPGAAVLLSTGGGSAPFGCHGWFRFDRKFWEPYLLPDRESAGGAHGESGIAEAS